MNNFSLYLPTDIRFGKEQIACLPEEISKYGKKILLVYGGGSIKKTGLYTQIMSLLNKDFEIHELSGITPNPKISSVREGVKICKKYGINAVLAVGGGSCIDASKNIAAGACYENDPWDLVLDNSKVDQVLPVFVVLTISATGSEMNNCAVISNEETCEKLSISTNKICPVLSVCDPSYLYTLPKRQTAAGAADILSHCMEQYFQKNDGAYITDRLTEGVMKSVLLYAPIAMKEPYNYEARSNLMWASTMGLNHILTSGKGGAWSCHPMEHELSAFYDIIHGEGLAILTPAWMKYVLTDNTKKRFAMFARNVFGIEEEDDMRAAEKGIERTKAFFHELELPARLSDVLIKADRFEEMAAETVRTSGISQNAYVPLTKEDIIRIFESCK